jgi:recombination protein RecA
MALPARLQQLSDLAAQAGLRTGHSAGDQVLPLGLGDLDAVLPNGGLMRGGVVELAVSGGAALGTSIALAACRSAQEQSQNGWAGTAGDRRERDTNWVAFIDPSGTLYGPGVVEAGVELSRLLVVRPPLDALSRVALRIAESQVFSLVVVDLVGVPGGSLAPALGSWPRIVRRLSMAVAGTTHGVLLVTDGAAPRPLPLPVAQRIELRRPEPDKLFVAITKDRLGRIAAQRSIAWSKGAWPSTVRKSNPPSNAEPRGIEHGRLRRA